MNTPALLDVEMNHYVLHASTFEVYEMCARREITPVDAAHILVEQHRREEPRMVRRFFHWLHRVLDTLGVP